ncbi:MAG: hypothetical protein GH148_06570 [Clostridia bacterium]|nr:hypothetical protein [Clostridia bacterium]
METIKRRCVTVDIPRSNYYYKPRKDNSFNLCLADMINEIALKHPYCRYKRIAVELARQEY